MMSSVCCWGQELEDILCTEQERYHRAGSEDGHDKEVLLDKMLTRCLYQMVELGKNTQEDTVR